tara:strand:+ start:332 stop:730 length:399 start_codon:yes stop_codon:yes gene_type:complete
VNLLDLKNGDRVTLTALFDDDGGGNPLKRLVLDDDDTNIYAEVDKHRTGKEHRETLFIQYRGNKNYQYISCQLDYDSHTQSFTIRDFKIESGEYYLGDVGWGATSGLYLVRPFNNKVSFINWLNENPFEVKK